MVTEIQFLTKNPGNLYVCGDCRRYCHRRGSRLRRPRGRAAHGQHQSASGGSPGRKPHLLPDAGLLLRDLNPVTIKRNHILYTVVPYYIMLT